MTSQDNTQNTHLEKLLPRCKTKDLDDFPGEYEHLDDSSRCWNCRVWEAIDKREQAAELRGRVDELSRNRTWMKRLCDYVDEWDAMQEYDDRLATLQATNPEKEEQS